MKQITERLWRAVEAIAVMRHRSVGDILRRYGYDLEAEHMDDLLAAYDEMKQQGTLSEDDPERRK